MRRIDKVELFTLSINVAKARKFRGNNESSEELERSAIPSHSALAEKHS